MSTRTIIQLIDDLDGSEADQTVRFGWDGFQYELDLTDKHADEMMAALEVYIQAARRVGRTNNKTRVTAPKAFVEPPRVPAKRDPAQLKAIRDWAVNKGFQVSPRGRIPADIERAFQEAHAAA